LNLSSFSRSTFVYFYLFRRVDTEFCDCYSFFFIRLPSTSSLETNEIHLLSFLSLTETDCDDCYNTNGSALASITGYFHGLCPWLDTPELIVVFHGHYSSYTGIILSVCGLTVTAAAHWNNIVSRSLLRHTGISYHLDLLISYHHTRSIHDGTFPTFDKLSWSSDCI